MNWNLFAQIYDWEFELIQKDQKYDVEFWKNIFKNPKDKILEIGCGSGRVTIPLSQTGIKISGLDYSAKMLEICKSRLKDFELNLPLYQSDMTDFNIAEKFSHIFYTYSSFQHLSSLEMQKKALICANRHLYNDGLISFDLHPAVCEGEDILAPVKLYRNFCSKLGYEVVMKTSHKTDFIQQTRVWNDCYFKIEQGKEKLLFRNEIILKAVSLEYMEMLLDLSGFRIVDVFGSFKFSLLDKNSLNLLIIAKKIKEV